MTWEEAKAIVDKIKYKENWRIDLEKIPFTVENAGLLNAEYLRFVFTMKVKDIASEMVIKVHSQMAVHMEINEEDLVRQIYHQIVSLERHEASEWFKYKGVAIFNEHDEEKRNGTEL